MREIDRADIARLHHSLCETPYQANRTLAVLRKIFNLCEMWDWRPNHSNPCAHIQKYKEHKRERMLSKEEIVSLLEALDALEKAKKHSVYHLYAIRLLVLTGARLNEILTLRWDQVSIERKEIRLLESKTGAKTIYLCDFAVEILGCIPHWNNNPYVIVGDKEGAHAVNINKAWYAARALAGLNNLRIHDLRHAFASLDASSGISLRIVGKMLGHTQVSTTARYAHLAQTAVKEAVERVGELMRG